MAAGEIRPVKHLETAGKLYPEAWRHIDTFRADRGRSLPDWPQWCFLPMAAWYSIVSEGGNMPLNRAPDVGRLAAIGAWRYTQGIYRFDADIYAALYDTVSSGDIPVEVLFRLPEWSVYIETPGRDWHGDTLYGFWAHLEHDINTGRPELRLLLDTEEQLLPVPLHIGKWTITEAVDRALNETKKQAAIAGVTIPPAPSDALAAQLYGLVSLVLYLCSDEPEIDDAKEPGTSPKRPSPIRSKGRWRLFPAKKPRYWTVARKLGEQLRQSADQQVGAGSKKSPHLRRAHWHGFWSGPRDGERRFHYKWLPPMVVAARD